MMVQMENFFIYQGVNTDGKFFHLSVSCCSVDVETYLCSAQEKFPICQMAHIKQRENFSVSVSRLHLHQLHCT